jgi:hypothetical protein
MPSPFTSASSRAGRGSRCSSRPFGHPKTNSPPRISGPAPTLVPNSSFWGASTGGWSSQDAYPRELANINFGDIPAEKADIVGFASNGVWTSISTSTAFISTSDTSPSPVSTLDLGSPSGVPVASPDVALLSQYMAGSFATSSDGNGGTLITDMPPITQPVSLTPPQA